MNQQQVQYDSPLRESLLEYSRACPASAIITADYGYPESLRRSLHVQLRITKKANFY